MYEHTCDVLINKPILGIIENMSYTVRPNCGARLETFGPGYAADLAAILQAIQQRLTNNVA